MEESYRRHLTQKEFVKTARERCIDIQKHITTFELMYLEFAHQNEKYVTKEREFLKKYTDTVEAENEFMSSLTPEESENMTFLDSNIKRCWDTLSKYKDDMANFRVIIMSSELLGDNAFYTIDPSGTLFIQYASRDELKNYKEYMKDVEKCYS